MWIACICLAALAVLPLGIRIRYNSLGLLLRVIAGPVKVTVYPRKKKTKRQKPKPAQKKSGAEASSEPAKDRRTQPPQVPAKEKPAETGGSLTRFLPFVKLGIRFLGDFRRKLRLDNLYLRLILASDDPCDLAVSYGRTWAAVGNLMPALEGLFVIRKRDVQVECDFTSSETTVVIHADITITLGRLLVLAACYGVRAVKLYFAMKRKGGA